MTKASRRDVGSALKLAKALTESLPLTAAGLGDGSVPVEHARAIAQLCLRSVQCVGTLRHPEPGELALNARDHGCAYPGCHAPPWMCQGAHAPPGGWAAGAGSNPEHGALLCYHHHPYVDDNHIHMTRTPDGGWAFLHPNGRRLGTSYPADHQPLKPPLPTS